MIQQALEDIRAHSSKLRHAAERAAGIMARKPDRRHSPALRRFLAYFVDYVARLVNFPAWSYSGCDG